MKGVDTIARVRREFLVRKRPIREIARELHISRNTVRKILRSEATAFAYERESQPLPRIGPWGAHGWMRCCWPTRGSPSGSV